MLYLAVAVVVAVVAFVLVYRLLASAPDLDPFLRNAILTVLALVFLGAVLYFWPGRAWP
jgi:hypothetical protein